MRGWLVMLRGGEGWVGEEGTRRVLEGEGDGGVENGSSSSGWEDRVTGRAGLYG